MFIGHTAAAFAAKKAAPKIRLGTLLLAAQFADLIFPIFILLGAEHLMPAPGITAFTPYDFYDYPISHSLAANIVWASIFASIYFFKRREWKGAVILACTVLSHWLLDFISHRPDMPIAPGLNWYAGLGLWNSVVWTVIIESSMFALGVYLYLRTTTAVDRTGSIALWSFIGLQVLLYIGDIVSKTPVDGHTMALFSLMQWLIVPWGYWIDRHRKDVVSPA
ncbi:MAG: hypothetical protein WAV76_12125 [Bacteroidota bacterium]